VLRGAKLVRVAEDIGGELSFHDCTLLLTRRGRAPYLVGCVAQIVAARRVLRAAGSRALEHKERHVRVASQSGGGGGVGFGSGFGTNDLFSCRLSRA